MTTSYPTPTPAPSVTPAWPAPRPDPDTQGRPLLTDVNIQGNVIAGFNKDHQVLLFVQLPSAATGQLWLSELVLPKLSSNADVAGFNARFSAARRASGSDPADLRAVWTNVSFTAAGFDLLAAADMEALRARTDLDPGVQLWLTGAADPTVTTAVGDRATDNAPTQWVFGADPTAVHAVVCIAADEPADLALELDQHRAWSAQNKVGIVFEQTGATLPPPSAGHEHFGFKDGISQPGIRGFDEPDSTGDGVAASPGTDLIAAGTFILGYRRDHAPAVPVPPWMFDGSFLVTRRLAQDVPSFWGNVEAQFATLNESQRNDATSGISSSDALAARMVGRWRSGTPTDSAPVVDNRAAQDPMNDNAFDFKDDPAGDHTPQCAHIRKIYPRSGATGGTPPLTEDDTMMRRILRRGIPYGPAFNPTAGPGHGVDAERGLVFQCYQTSLSDQFQFLQQAWVNQPAFPTDGTGNDPVIGVGGACTIRAGGQPSSLMFSQWVHTRGSLYSLTPSLPTVRALAGGTPLANA